MILQEIVLHNFKTYRGRHSIDLRPDSASKPLILIGGLNGAGKTSLLEALQLVLYGKLANVRNRNGASYEDFLRECIHRSVPTHEGMAVELEFDHTSAGDTTRYRLHRSWKTSRKKLRERFEVQRDGERDSLLSSEWDQFVQDLIPSNLAPLFFFDGERIEELADLDQATKALSVAIHSLLGIDLVDQLTQDLKVLKRRKLIELQRPREKQKIQNLQTALKHAEDERAAAKRNAASLSNEVTLSEKALTKADDAFKKGGGELFENRKQLERAFEGARESVAEVEEQLRDLAAGEAPLALIRPLLADCEEQAKLENSAEQGQIVAEVLEARDLEVVDHIRKLGASSTILGALEGHLATDRQERQVHPQGDFHLNLGREATSQLYGLTHSHLGAIESRAQKLLKSHARLQANLEEHEQRLASIPDEAGVAGLLRQRETVRERLDKARIQHARALEESRQGQLRFEEAKKALDSEVQRRFEADLRHEDLGRVVTFSGKVEGTLEEFRQRVLDDHAERLQDLIVECFQQLIRKPDLISEVQIDPDDLSLVIRNPKGQEVSPSQLSAGERQLFAVSLLWGLAKASGRPIPTIIDTPLGRLDSTHRKHLVSRYFPRASHQVVLLSTDEEISGSYLESLDSHVSKKYLLNYDPSSESSRVENAYFE